MVYRRFGTLVSLLALLAAVACGSSSTTSTAPATVPQCGVSLGSADMTVPASGGNGRVAVTTARECSWTATSSASWLTIRGAASGQGDGSVEFVAAANSDPSSRRGVIALNDQQASVTQAAADCSLTLADSSASLSQAGGSGTVQVRASSAQCTWSASADVSWIVIRSGST